MNRRAHRIGRGVTCLGLASTAAYLGWRLATLPSRPPIWLVVLAIVVEITGFIGSVILTWAMWQGTLPALDETTLNQRVNGGLQPTEIDVVVRVAQEPIHHIRATMLSLRSMATGRQVVVDLAARPEVASIAAEFGAEYRASDLEDHNGLKACSAASTTPIFFLLDGGDIPSPRAVHQLLPLMDDDSVAVVTGQSLMADDDSAEHGPNGLHELTFERETLNPCLGAKGAALFTV